MTVAVYLGCKALNQNQNKLTNRLVNFQKQVHFVAINTSRMTCFSETQHKLKTYFVFRPQLWSS